MFNGSTKKRVIKPAFIALWLIVAILLVAAPTFVNPALRSFLFFLLMWIALSQSFNLFTGLTGYVNFGFVVFYGIGGYGMTLSLLRLNLPIYLALIVGGLVSAAFAIAVSLPALRLRGAYFAIAMLSLAQAVFVIFDNWNFVNSATGYTIPVQYYNPTQQYYAMLAIAAATTIQVCNPCYKCLLCRLGGRCCHMGYYYHRPPFSFRYNSHLDRDIYDYAGRVWHIVGTCNWSLYTLFR